MLGPPLCPSRLLVGTHHGAINKVQLPVQLARRIPLFLELGQDAVPDPSPSLAAEAAMDS